MHIGSFATKNRYDYKNQSPLEFNHCSIMKKNILNSLSSLLSPNPSVENRFIFETDTDGNFSIYADWVRVFQHLSVLEEYSFMTQHPYCNMQIQTPALGFCWAKEGEIAVDSAQQIILHPASALKMIGNVNLCKHCGSPGSLSVIDRGGVESIKVSCTNQVSLDTWARVMMDCSREPLKQSLPDVDSISFPVVVAKDLMALDLNPAVAIVLFEQICSDKQPFDVTLTSSVCVHKARIYPEHIHYRNQCLRIDGQDSILQILPHVWTRLYLNNVNSTSPKLIFGGPMNTCLLEVECEGLFQYIANLETSSWH